MEKTEKKEGEKKGSRRDTIHFDYKNTEMLKEYINPHARILGRRRSLARINAAVVLLEASP